MVLSLGLLGAAGVASDATSSHTYVVQPGDSLWAIARANGISVAQLAMANGMAESDVLLIGRHLVVPSDTPAPQPVQATTSTATPGANPANAWTYCRTFTPSGGPVGQLPSLLLQSPGRLALQPVFIKWANYYDLSLPLLEAIAWQESGWQQGVTSSAGAIGTGQLMPDTATFIQQQLVGSSLNIHAASDNIRMSAAFLTYLAGVEGNNQCDTIAAYYEGPQNMSQDGVFTETQIYVASVEALIPRFE